MPREQLTAQEIQLIGEILLPMFKDAMRVQFHRVRDDLSAAVSGVESKMHDEHMKLNARIDELSRRVKALELMRYRVMAAYGFIIAVMTVAYHAGKDWFLKHVWK